MRHTATHGISNITAAFKRLLADSDTPDAIAALRLMASVCAACATDLTVDAMDMADAFDMAQEAKVREYTPEETKAHAASHYSEMARDAAREAAHG